MWFPSVLWCRGICHCWFSSRHCVDHSPDWLINSLTPGKSGFNFKSAIINLVLLIGIFRSSYDNALKWMSWDLPEDKSTLVQVMAWCRQVTSHYLSQCWPRSLSPYGVTRPQRVNSFIPEWDINSFKDDKFQTNSFNPYLQFSFWLVLKFDNYVSWSSSGRSMLSCALALSL